MSPVKKVGGVVRHSAHDAPSANSGQIQRRAGHSRTAPPAACTTSTAVRELILLPTLEQRAIVDLDLRDLMEAARLTKDPELIACLRRIAERAVTRSGLAQTVAGKADSCAQKLEEAEAQKDWDGLADLRCFTGREIAGFINDPLDICNDPMRLGEMPEARRKLAGWFAQFGEDIFAEHIEVGVRRRRGVLRREFDRWLIGQSA